MPSLVGTAADYCYIPSKKGISSSLVLCAPRASAMVDNLRIAFRRRRTSSCFKNQHQGGTVLQIGGHYLKLVHEDGYGEKFIGYRLEIHHRLMLLG